MSDKKQTAVELFHEKVEQHILTFGSINSAELKKHKEISLQIEKERLKESYIAGLMNPLPFSTK